MPKPYGKATPSDSNRHADRTAYTMQTPMLSVFWIAQFSSRSPIRVRLPYSALNAVGTNMPVFLERLASEQVKNDEELRLSDGRSLLFRNVAFGDRHDAVIEMVRVFREQRQRRPCVGEGQGAI